MKRTVKIIGRTGQIVTVEHTRRRWIDSGVYCVRDDRGAVFRFPLDECSLITEVKERRDDTTRDPRA